MSEEKYQYVYLIDNMGEALGYFVNLNKSTGVLQVKFINFTDNGKWVEEKRVKELQKTCPITSIALNKCSKVTYYENYEDFVAEHFAEVL